VFIRHPASKFRIILDSSEEKCNMNTISHDITQKKRSAGAVIQNIGGIEEHNRRLTDRT
jgi:hypothetical protein